MATNNEARVFISYSRVDEESAQKIASELEKCKVPVWLDKKHLRGGVNWKDRIHDVITRECRFVLLLFSSRSVEKRGYVNVEINAALQVLNEFPPDAIFLIPVRLDQCEPRHRKLHDISWIDMFPEWDDGIEEILASLRNETSMKLIEPQRVSWKPDKDGESGIEIRSFGGGFVSWDDLKPEIESKLLPSVRNLPVGCYVSRGSFRGRKNWIIQVFDAQGNECAHIWFGGDPENGWTYDGLVRIGSAKSDEESPVWQTWQRYSDRSYRRVKVHD